MEQLLELLTKVLSEPRRSSEHIAKFQAIVWEGLNPVLPENVREVLRELAYDLDFFEALPEFRNEDSALYGQERLEREIREAFEKLRAAGVDTPPLNGRSE